MYISPIQNRRESNYHQTSFQAKHLPRSFSSMMNYLYKNLPTDQFEASSAIRVSTVLKDGKEVHGVVNFLNGRYHNLVLDEGFENLAQEFKRTALMRYNKRVASPRLQQKLGYTE